MVEIIQYMSVCTDVQRFLAFVLQSVMKSDCSRIVKAELLKSFHYFQKCVLNVLKS